MKKLKFFDFAYVCCRNDNYNKVAGREARDMRCISHESKNFKNTAEVNSGALFSLYFTVERKKMCNFIKNMK